MRILAFDCGGTRFKGGEVSEDGRMITFCEVVTPQNLKDYKSTLLGLIEQVVDGRKFDAIGFGSKGILVNTKIVWQPAPQEYLVGFSYRDLIQSVYPQMPVFANTDAKVALLGEARWGAARGLRNVILFTFGTHVGSAVFVNGELLLGHHGGGGILGHVLADSSGTPCGCGSSGCIRTVFCAEAIERQANEACLTDIVSTLTQLQKVTCKDVFDAAARGDLVSKNIIQNSIQKLGGALAGMVYAFDPEAIIIGGQIAEAGEAIFQPLQEIIHYRTRYFVNNNVKLIKAQLGESGVLGAAALAMDGVDLI